MAALTRSIVTRSLAAGAVAALGLGSVGAVGAAASPASAGTSQSGDRSNGPQLALTKSAVATLDSFDVDVSFTKKVDRRQGHRHGALRGSVVFDGRGTDATWSKIRINDRTNRVTAVVNGGERRAVLKFKDARAHDRRGHGSTVLRLTAAGANSIDAAAGADAFDAGDSLAKAGHRHR